MRKEIFWIIIVGVSLGIILAIGIHRINLKLKNTNQYKVNPTSVVKVNNDFKIVLNKPENEDVVIENNIAIEGITRANSWIAISAVEKDYLVKANEKGLFNQTLDLVGGINEIKISAFNEKYAKSEIKIVVIYSSSFVKTNLEEIKNENLSTESSIRTKVQEKVNQVLSRPKGYIGTVTDKTNSSLEIKSNSGEIKQISIENPEMNVVKLGSINKEIKLIDIAIGDTIAALGYKDENAVLLAQRILVMQEIQKEPLDVVMGTISKITKNSVFIDEVEYTFNKTAKIKFTSLKEGQQIIIVGKRSLFILE